MSTTKRTAASKPATSPNFTHPQITQFDGARIAADSDPRLFILSVEKAMRVLYAFDDADRALPVSAIAKKTGFGRSATQRLVYTLERLRYIRRDPVTRAYSLTPRVLDFARSYLGTDPLVAIALRHLAAINDQCGEAVSLTENDDTENIVVARVACRHPISINSSVIGTRFPAFCSAPGRAILAFLPEEQALDIIDRSSLRPLTAHTIVDRERLIDVLAEIRETGFTIAEQEIFLGAISVAVPVLDATGRPMGAVNCMVPIARWPRDKAVAELVPIIRQAAYELSRSLGSL